MKARSWKRPLLIVGGFLVLIAGVVAAWLFQEIEYKRVVSPDGNYTAIVTLRRYESLRSALPGQGGDIAGFIRIEDKNGTNHGKVAVPMVWMVEELKWTKEGASIKSLCDWDFAKREVRLWE